MRPAAALLRPVTRRLVYPSRSTRLSPDGASLHLTVGGTRLRGWVVNPGQRRGLVYFGGNGEGVHELREELEQRFPHHTSYLLAYRGYGASEGRPSERALVDDAVALLDHVAARHPEAPVDVIGRSLGSGVAVQAAVRRPVERLVLVTPFDSLVAVAQDLFPRLPMARLRPRPLRLRGRRPTAAGAGARAPCRPRRAGPPAAHDAAARDPAGSAPRGRPPGRRPRDPRRRPGVLAAIAGLPAALRPLRRSDSAPRRVA